MWKLCGLRISAFTAYWITNSLHSPTHSCYDHMSGLLTHIWELITPINDLTHPCSLVCPTAAMVLPGAFYLLLPTIAAADLFVGYNCNTLKDTHYVSHDQCHLTKNLRNIEQFTIVQKKSVSGLKGFKCKGQRTTEINFCGAYRWY